MPGTDHGTPVPRPVAPDQQSPTQAGPNPPAEPAEPAGPPAAGRPPSSRRVDPPVLPDVTSDERDIGWGDWPDSGDDDRYLREVPPHHGG